MEKELLLRVLARMREYGEIKDPVISSHINMMLRAGRIEEVYELLEEDNLIIILRSIAKQYFKLEREGNLSMGKFEKIVSQKGIKNNPVVSFFSVCMLIDTEEAIEDFFSICDTFHKYYN